MRSPVPGKIGRRAPFPGSRFEPARREGRSPGLISDWLPTASAPYYSGSTWGVLQPGEPSAEVDVHCDVLVIGGGIAGALAACELSDSGVDVVMLDRLDTLMSGASRWNEGKLHLGFTYVGTEQLDTPALMIRGSAEFQRRIESLSGRRFDPSWFSRPIVYLVDAASQFDADTLWERSARVAELIARALPEGAAARSSEVPILRRMHPDDAAAATGQPSPVAAWETCEQAIAPGPVAALVRQAVERRPIRCRRGTALAVAASPKGWEVAAEESTITARCVVNASWESRVWLDRLAGAKPEATSIRFKFSLFGTGLTRVHQLAPSTRILGRFGDVTPYGNGDAYLSWYPAALASLSDDGTVPPCPQPGGALVRTTLGGLGLPETILEDPARWMVAGGWVVAPGQGDIDHPGSPLHRRNRAGARELAPGWITADTGKFSLGPAVAMEAAVLVRARLGMAEKLPA